MNNESLPEKLILSSSSKYRIMLLQRLGIPFASLAPEIDESVRADESPGELVSRLASSKASVNSLRFPQALVIGSDQLAVLNGQVMGKPGTHEVALEQLRSLSGQTVEFLTSVSVQRQEDNFAAVYTDCTRVGFRSLKDEEIERYLLKEEPYDCSGAFKAEALGITLFDYISSEDPTALIGLPLIRTSAMLRMAGMRLP